MNYIGNYEYIKHFMNEIYLIINSDIYPHGNYRTILYSIIYILTLINSLDKSNYSEIINNYKIYDLTFMNKVAEFIDNRRPTDDENLFTPIKYFLNIPINGIPSNIGKIVAPTNKEQKTFTFFLFKLIFVLYPDENIRNINPN